MSDQDKSKDQAETPQSEDTAPDPEKSESVEAAEEASAEVEDPSPEDPPAEETQSEEPATEEVSSPIVAPPPKQSGGSPYTAISLAIVGSLAAATISTWGPPIIGYPKPVTDTAAIDLLNEQMAGLTTRLDSLDATTLPALEDRLAALEAVPQTDPSVISGLESDVGTLQDGVASVETQLQSMNDAIQAADATEALDGLGSRVEGLEGSLSDLDGRLATVQSGLTALESASESTSLKTNASLILAVDSAQAAVDLGRGFADLMPNLEALAQGDDGLAPALEILGTHADTGVTSKQALVAQFPAIARQMRQNVNAPTDQSLLSKTLSNITNLVDVRPSGQAEEATPDNGQMAAITAAEAYVADDQLGDAIAALASLDGAARTVASDWVTEATENLSVNEALLQLRQAALTRLGQGAG